MIKAPPQSTQHPVEQPGNKRDTGCISLVFHIRHSQLGRLLFTVLAVIVVGLAGYYVSTKLIISLRQVRETHLILKPFPVISSLLITIFCVLFGGLTWNIILHSLGILADFRDNLRTYLLANLAGYIPGYGWQYLGKAYLASRQNISPILATSAVLIEFLCSALTRLAVSFSFLSIELWHQITGCESVAGLWLLRFIAWLGVISLPWILNYAQRSKLGLYLKITQPVRVPLLWVAEIMMCLGWIIYGLGFAALLRSMTYIPLDTLSPVIFSTTSSYLVSLLIFFVPAGIGVREGVLIYILTGVLPEVVVSLSSVLSRIVVIVAELIGVLLGLCLRGFRLASKRPL